MTDFPPIRSLWNFSDPQQSREKFKEIIKLNNIERDHPYYLEIITQIARTYGLEHNFDKGHSILEDHLPNIDQSNPLVKTRYHLEKGRLYNSSGDSESALSQFYRAYDLAKASNFHYLVVDVAHMIAIATSDEVKALDWNQKAISYAMKSNDPEAQKWLGSLYNNTGWSYFDMKNYEMALDMFEKGLALRREEGNEEAIRIAKWTIGRVYRAMNRINDALQIMNQLEDEAIERNSEPSGYTYEELGELYLMQDDIVNSKAYFVKAFEKLSQDTWFVNNENDRLDRIKSLSQS